MGDFCYQFPTIHSCTCYCQPLKKKGFDNDPIEEKQEIKIRGGDRKIKHKNVIFRVDYLDIKLDQIPLQNLASFLAPQNLRAQFLISKTI